MLVVCLILALGLAGISYGAAPPLFRQYCVQCHGKTPQAGLNLEALIARPSVGKDFAHWEKVAAALEQKRMPPAKMPKPGDAERARAVAWVRARLNAYARAHAGDPGRVTVRRLTSGEYAYTIGDLTGLDWKTDADFASDAVGGEGFANFGDVQFIDSANLERYLDAAKRIAEHAVIGAGPLEFFDDPGQSGMELSAISRIQQIYRAHGFRAASAEGGRPYGLERYGKALYASWRYHHRQAASLEEAAKAEGLSPRFLEHIWGVLQDPTPTYPTSEVVSRWKNLPASDAKAARTGCEEIQHFLIEWPRWLLGAGGAAEGGQGDERALVLTDASVQATPSHQFRFFARSKEKTARVYLSTVSMNPAAKDKPAIRWRNGVARFRGTERGGGTQQPLLPLLSEETRKRLGIAPGAEEFTLRAGESVFLDIPLPEGAGGLGLEIEAAMEASQEAVVRCTVSNHEELSKGRPDSALLGHPTTAAFRNWKSGVLAFAARMPQISQGEPTPADRDPIPSPFNDAYNQPERDRFHTQLKYYRDDRFLVEKMLDNATRTKLEHAWADLLSSFEYHDLFLRFVGEKFKLDLKKSIADLTAAEIAALPAEPRKYVTALRAEYDSIVSAREAAQAGHVEESLGFASQAWRRPLTQSEKDGLRRFYTEARESGKLDHTKALRALLARILVAPAFLYRLESPGRLSSWEMASRMSYFLWSSVPDAELRRAAAAGELLQAMALERQAKRMLADPKARRLSTEFFGQWLGFYRFDQHRDVDAGRFPEFTGEVKSAMYDEAVSFFEHIIRKDRPMGDVLFADYTFLNPTLAKHYGVSRKFAGAEFEQVDGAQAFHRGGLLRLGAVLTATSAPLRTSPVKRGDWVLRRVLGTPTPPPPADAGSIPADDKLFGGLSVQERLAAHQRNPSCASCHTRIDPLGFPLESYDPVGRWRKHYADGKPIDDASALADQTKIAGVDGLLEYLKTQERQVLRTMSSKLVGYALGRTVQPSDQLLIDRMTAAGGETRFSKMVTEIVTSRQFRQRRLESKVEGK